LNARRIIKVLIGSLDGTAFLTAQQGQWGFTKDRAQAAVFDYLDDRVAEQLERLERDHGIVLKPVPLDLKEVYETCDRCDQMVAPFRAYFDGKHFLCDQCKGEAA
jgi:hypothetical protein